MTTRVSTSLMIAAAALICSCAPATNRAAGTPVDNIHDVSPLRRMPPQPAAVLLTPEQMLTQKLYSYEHISASAQRVELADEPFAEALRIVLQDVPDNFWEIQTLLPNHSPIAEGDVLLVEFYLRAIHTEDQSGQVQLSVYFQDAGPPWDKSLFHLARAAEQWRHYVLPFRARRDYPRGKGLFCFGLGYARQTLDLAGVRLVNYGPDVEIEDLPAIDETDMAHPPRSP